MAFGISLLCAPGSALAQQEGKYKPLDLKPLVPPVFSLPSDSQFNFGSVGGTQTPGVTAPMQNRGAPPSGPTAGIKLSIPTREDQ
jgi:hypothetical protein